MSKIFEAKAASLLTTNQRLALEEKAKKHKTSLSDVFRQCIELQLIEFEKEARLSNVNNPIDLSLARMKKARAEISKKKEKERANKYRKQLKLAKKQG